MRFLPLRQVAFLITVTRQFASPIKRLGVSLWVNRSLMALDQAFRVRQHRNQTHFTTATRDRSELPPWPGQIWPRRKTVETVWGSARISSHPVKTGC